MSDVNDRDSRLAMILLSLDRCEHGRHQGDDCFNCGGPSVGNRLLQPGQVIGHGYSGAPIVMPERRYKADPEAWYGEPT